MKGWSEEKRLESQSPRPPARARARPEVPQAPKDDSGFDADDPFAPRASSASHALEPGWLIESTASIPDEFVPVREHAPETHVEDRGWRQRAAALGGRLREVERRTTARLWAPRYPLAGSRHLAGLPVEDRGRLTRAFREATSPRAWRSRTAALAHLESLLPTWPLQDISEMRGVHVFLGSAGSGKTTMALKVAHRLTRAGQRIGLLALFPQSPERLAAFREAALRVPAPALFAQTDAQLNKAVQQLASCDTILIDTPCLLSQPARSRRMARLGLLQESSTVLHYCLCLHHARAFRRRELAAAAAHGVDFLALSHVDLAPGPGALLSLQLHTPQPVSLANALADVHDPLVPFGAAALLRALGQTRTD